ncbi:hypothetical protein WK94_06775 [Burkholderia ubonensis]|nr:hypothetical protein WI78_31090 [Burkholderia ubonensis]KVW29593.1 hypothetical protein WK94_06775 [Burkholderia ubonensis]KVX90619.1 hypothetical protein WL09_10230 [Burkholderia ubonensis]KWB53875.1 hypothetical protein WL37_03385 [Burkholderia ubonensis]KWC51547.1 hypothetical protein WL53_01965 [Burkholderia ubonensis]
MLEKHCFEHRADHTSFVICQCAQSIEQQSEIVTRSNFILVKQQRVCADGQSDGQSLDDIDGWSVHARFIASYLHDVNMHAVGELLLGQAALHAQLR